MSSTTPQLRQDRLDLVADLKLKLLGAKEGLFDITMELAETVNRNVGTTSSLAQARLDLAEGMNSEFVEVVEESFDLTTELFETISQDRGFEINKNGKDEHGDGCTSNGFLDSARSLNNMLADLQLTVKSLEIEKARLDGENDCLKKESRRLWDRDGKLCQQINERHEKNRALDNARLLQERDQARAELAKLKQSAGTHLSGCKLTKEEEQLLAEQSTEDDEATDQVAHSSREFTGSDWLMIL